MVFPGFFKSMTFQSLIPLVAACCCTLATVTVALEEDAYSVPEEGEVFPGGALTPLQSRDKNSFSRPLANLPADLALDFAVGNGLFKKLWVSGHTATTASDGLGPLYNARSCASCHPRRGRGRPQSRQDADEASPALMLHLSIPPQDTHQAFLLHSGKETIIPEPVYGRQLQPFAVPGLPGKGRVKIAYTDVDVTLGDGEKVVLRRPQYSIQDHGHGPMHRHTMFSPRIAPQLIGLGLLEGISEAVLLANADPDDTNGDGISGKPNRLWSEEQQLVIGRFGHKAAKPTLNEQVQAAFANDIGISVPLFPQAWGDCSDAQTACRQAEHGVDERHDGLEASGKVTEMVTFYLRNLAVPKRIQAADKEILEGKKLFHETGCAACHHPSFRTRPNDGQTALSQQLIWPYSDLLLHDMGEGLADHRPEGAANGREWRTAPLWGIGLTETVGGHSYFLHDGRARNLQEAILWHGGEGQSSRENFANLANSERRKLLAFVESL